MKFGEELVSEEAFQEKVAALNRLQGQKEEAVQQVQVQLRHQWQHQVQAQVQDQIQVEASQEVQKERLKSKKNAPTAEMRSLKQQADKLKRQLVNVRNELKEEKHTLVPMGTSDLISLFG